jgi:hypothetical protein
MSATRLSVHSSPSVQSALQVWYLRELRPKLAFAVRRQDVDRAQAAELDRVMQELLLRRCWRLR